ncbi:DUF4113 domain-containing protein [Roseovarius tibetensis]|uniref:DUF4113 domain-containing protein n=1 Tax=Roseovarius tibetensis TaxID=2685897 RepID=UPI003D7FB3F9
MPVYPIEAPVLAEGQVVPISLARASAGFPSPAADDLEDKIDPIAWVVRHPSRPQYAGSRTTRIVPMSSDTFDLVAAAKRCASAAWPKADHRNYAFTKAGVMLNDLLPLEDRPRTLFDTPRGSPELMTALDAVNNRFGKKTMVLASEGMSRSWQLRADHRSPRYTTRISDLPVVR